MKERPRDGVADGIAAAAGVAGGIADMGYARLDIHREQRTGLAEVIWCPGKTPEQIRGIAAELLGHGTGPVLATRADATAFEAVRDLSEETSYDEVGRVIVLRRAIEQEPLGHVAVITAGTADLPVAQEAMTVAGALGCKTTRITDIGVAGLHRALDAADDLRAADVLIVVAGMEGALPSVVAGLVSTPVIGLPTSIGYGASFGGVSALLTMLTSCAPGIAVVNIDNGFGAAVLAARILRLRQDRR